MLMREAGSPCVAGTRRRACYHTIPSVVIALTTVNAVVNRSPQEFSSCLHPTHETLGTLYEVLTIVNVAFVDYEYGPSLCPRIACIGR